MSNFPKVTETVYWIGKYSYQIAVLVVSFLFPSHKQKSAGRELQLLVQLLCKATKIPLTPSHHLESVCHLALWLLQSLIP